MAGIPAAFESDFKDLASTIAAYLSAVPAAEREGLLQALNELVRADLERKRAYKENAPKPDPETLAGFTSEPAPLEIVAEAIRNFNEKETMAELEEMLNGKGFKLEDFLPGLERLTDQGNEPQT
jgi:hypothetical protein